MASASVNREEQGSQVLGARLSKQEWKHFREILRNYEIYKSSVSDQLRALLRFDLVRSRRFRRSQGHVHSDVQPAAQVLRDAAALEDAEEDEELYPGVVEPWENERGDPDYFRLRDEAIMNLRSRGCFADVQSVWAEVEVLKERRNKKAAALDVGVEL